MTARRLFALGNLRAKRNCCVVGAEAVAHLQATCRQEPKPAPFAVTWLKVLGDVASCGRVSFRADHTRVLYLDVRPLLRNLLKQHEEGVDDVGRFEAGDDMRFTKGAYILPPTAASVRLR